MIIRKFKKLKKNLLGKSHILGISIVYILKGLYVVHRFACELYQLR